MKLAPIILATALSSPVVAQQVPATPGMMQSIQGLIASSMMLCEKHKIPDKECQAKIDASVKAIRKKVDEVCKDFPKEKVSCIQYGLEYLMDRQIEKNIISLNSKTI